MPNDSENPVRHVVRAAGTRTALDLLRRPGWVIGRPDRTPEDDLRDLAEGRSLAVSAFSRTGRRFRQGLLVLDPSARPPIVWRPYRPFRPYGPAVPLAPPYDVQEVGPVRGPGSWNVERARFTMITLRADGALWELAVPAPDVRVVRRAFATAR